MASDQWSDIRFDSIAWLATDHFQHLLEQRQLLVEGLRSATCRRTSVSARIGAGDAIFLAEVV